MVLNFSKKFFTIQIFRELSVGTNQVFNKTRRGLDFQRWDLFAMVRNLLNFQEGTGYPGGTECLGGTECSGETECPGGTGQNVP